MDLNPLNEDCKRLSKEIAQLRRQHEQVAHELAWYHSINVSGLTSERDQLQQKIRTLGTVLAALQREIVDLENRKRGAEAKLGSWLLPWNWFNDAQRQLREELRQLSATLATKFRSKDDTTALLNQARSRVAEIIKTLDRHRQINPIELNRRLTQLQQQIESREREWRQLDEQRRTIEATIAPLRQEISRLEAEKRQLQMHIEQAREFQRQLNAASTARERWCIHRECEQHLGCEKPHVVIQNLQVRLKQVQRDLEKLCRRIQECVNRLLRRIETIVIDGSNLCYEDSTFIGLAALEVLVPALVAKNYDVVVIFDASIRPRLKVSDDHLRKTLGPQATVHIVNSKQSADDLILRLASRSECAFVLSNDRFREYPDSPVVKANRFIRHEIVDGRIFIRDLELDLSY